jgi:GntR family transcriptional regulator
MLVVKFEQVAAEIRRAIAEGEARPGERLPPAKDLAAVLGVNTNTVLRALRQLRDEGLLEFRRGRGITVAGTVERGSVITQARELVRFARRQGYTTAELVEIITQLGEFPRPSASSSQDRLSSGRTNEGEPVAETRAGGDAGRRRAERAST